MANITKKGEGKYLIRVSKGTGKGRQFINKTFLGSLAEARRFAREIETVVDTERFETFKVMLLEALRDPQIKTALGLSGPSKLAEVVAFNRRQA